MSKLIPLWLACSFMATTAPAGAQPVSADSPQVMWRLSAGRDVAGLRDISRTNIPVDASPVQWRGTGLGLLAQHTRERGRWRQEFSAALTRATEFHYEVGDVSTPRPSDDRFTRADAHYTLHRRLFADVGIRGVSVAAGLRLGMGRTSAERHVPADLTATESRISAATAFVITVGFRRGRGPGMDVEWSNGGHVGRLSAWHSSDQVSRTQWGGGWQTDLAIEGDIPIGRRTAVVARYFRSNDGALQSHRSVASARSSLSLGVIMAGRWTRALASIGVALTLVSCDMVMGPTTPDHNWTTVNTSRFTFRVRPGSFAEQSVPTLTSPSTCMSPGPMPVSGAMEMAATAAAWRTRTRRP